MKYRSSGVSELTVIGSLARRYVKFRLLTCQISEIMIVMACAMVAPNGDFMILTLEGENPEEGWGKIISELPEDFAEFAMDVHGMDVNAPSPPMPTLVYDSKVK